VIKRFVCLANSRKLYGRCIAGRELVADVPGEWIRPVSNREHEEVSEYERQYVDGGDPRVLDIIDVPLLGPRVKSYQSENWLLDPKRYWRKVGEFRRDDLSLLVDPPCILWLNGHGTYSGRNDCVPAEDAGKVGSSLKLIAVPDGLKLRVYKPGEARGDPKRRVQAHFSFGGVGYRLWVTDPLIESAYLAQLDGMYALGPSYLTISLGEPWHGNCYKFVAAIIGASQ
jgi:putative nucleic acid modification protein with dual OB domain